MNIIQKDISTFAQSGFPAFYLEEGPVFVAFAKAYYSWLESQTPAATTNVTASSVSVIAGNTQILGINTTFSKDFSTGDSIAIWKTPEYYDIFTINGVVSNTVLTVNENPLFTNVLSTYAQVALKRNHVYDSRRLLEYTDIDQTIDDYIIHFKNKYLADIQFNTQIDIRLLLKHTLDLYRAKGTPQALQLLFRVVFGTEIDIYYPGDDVFRLSDGQWVTPKYIEIVLSNKAVLATNRQVYGSLSNATAFVDRVVRRNNGGTLSDVLYISAINGNFFDGDLLDFTSGTRFAPEDRLVVRGSLTNIDIDLNGTGVDFKVGDIVSVESNTGRDAKARVTSVVNQSGVINFALTDGGYGYESDSNTQVLVSESVLKLSNVSIDATYNPWVNTYTDLFETIVQPTANINYISSNGSFTVGDSLFSYANSVLKSVSTILNVNQTNSTSGYLQIAQLSGNLNSGQFYSTGNVVGANVNPISGYVDTTATGNNIGEIQNLTVTIGTPNFVPVVNDFIYQVDEVGGIRSWATVSKVVTFGSNVILTVNTSNCVFRLGSTMFDSSNTAIGNTIDVSLSVGIINVTSAFITSNGNFVYFKDSNTHAVVSSVSQGALANVSVSNDMMYVETINVGNVFLNTYKSVYLGANAYGFPAAPTANHTSYIADTRTFATVNVGRLTQLTNINQGINYTAAPLVRVINKAIYPYFREDYTLQVDNGPFQTGEIVTQVTTNARGIVTFSNSTFLSVERLRFYDTDDFITTIDTSTTIVGSNSGLTSNILSVSFSSEAPSGFDAVITTTLTTANGSIANVQVIDSGFGFVSGQTLTLTGNAGSTGTGVANCVTYGVGSGFYQQKGGFLSDQKKLHDGYYYQDFSYDVRSPVTLDKYSDMLRQITHVAGTKNFASLVTTKIMDTEIAVQKSSYIIGISSNTDGAIYIETAGISKGLSTAISYGIGFIIGSGTANGNSTAQGVSAKLLGAVGVANGSSSALANGVSYEFSYGVANGSSSASAPSLSLTFSPVIGNANGSSSASAPSLSLTFSPVIGNANGSSSAASINATTVPIGTDFTTMYNSMYVPILSI